jgi:hypothetical protein
VLCSPDGDQAAVKVKASVRGQVVEVELPGLTVWGILTPNVE